MSSKIQINGKTEKDNRTVGDIIKTLVKKQKEIHKNSPVVRRISCHGRKHSQASCEYSLTIFLCCQHHSEYSLLGSKFSTNLLFAASKCHVTIKTKWQFEMFKMAEPDGIVAVVKHCWLLVQGRRGCREKSLNTTTG